MQTQMGSLQPKMQEIQEKYKVEVEKTHIDSQAISSKNKLEILAKEREIIIETEEKISSEYEAKRTHLLKEMNEKRAIVLSDASVLSNSLIEKLTK